MGLLLRASKVVDGSAEVVIDSGQVIIGRLPSNNLVIPGNDVEPIHAMVERDSQTGDFTLIDVGSDSGVKLNGRMIEVVEKIVPGDVIEIGSIRIEVLDPEMAVSQESESVRESINVPRKGPSKERRTVIAQQVPSKDDEQESEDDNCGSKRTARIGYGEIFQPGKQRPSGNTLEVVAFWGLAILDVRHYGGRIERGESERLKSVYIGNEEDGHMIGVGPHARTRNYLFADVLDSKTTIHLNNEMQVKVRRGGRFEKVNGPAEVQITPSESAIVQHGPLHYFFTSCTIPNPVLKKFEDLDGKPIIFWYASFIYLCLFAAIFWATRGPLLEKPVDAEVWSQVFTMKSPTPQPPAPKKIAEIKRPTPPPVAPPKKEVVTPPPPKPPTKALDKPQVVKQEPPKQNSRGEQKSKEAAVGRQTAAKDAGNSGGPKGGTAGAFAGQREGKEKADMMGVEGGKPNVLSGINMEQLGAGLGKISNIDGIGAVATGLKTSQGGGAGGGAGSGARGAHGFGGLGNQASLSTGGPAGALAGLGGGGGGLGKGGLGDPNGRGSGMGTKMKTGAVVVPEGDPAIEGSLTKEEIEAVIRANIAQIRACYERNLQGKRDLSGKVTSKFVISPSGQVSSSSIASSELNHSPTENCIAGAIRRWKFPLPRGGGSVHVNYPFMLSPVR